MENIRAFVILLFHIYIYNIYSLYYILLFSLCECVNEFYVLLYYLCNYNYELL